jgi:Uma2 family endonuclease
MAITTPPPASKLLTYEEYVAEGVIEGSYDIVDGRRIFMATPTWEHQKIALNIASLFRDYQKATARGEVMVAPFDALIRRTPRLQTRQPDVFFISNEQLATVGGVPKITFLEVAPELVIEIISDSETEQRIEAKIKDYIAIGVRELWRVWPETRTVEVLRLTPDGPEVAAVYDETQTLQSLTFFDLALPVAAFFTS